MIIQSQCNYSYVINHNCKHKYRLQFFW